MGQNILCVCAVTLYNAAKIKKTGQMCLEEKKKKNCLAQISKAAFTLQALLFNFDFLLRLDLRVLLVHIYNYKWAVSKCNMNASVLQNIMYALSDTFLHESCEPPTTKTYFGDESWY